MTDIPNPNTVSPTSTIEIEQGDRFLPKFDANGLLPVIVTEASSGTVLMFAYMNAEALKLSLETRIAHFWTRSRQRLWKKGEDSGNLLTILDARTDCDQDVLWLSVAIAGQGVACHTGSHSCFYRKVALSPGSQGTPLSRSEV
ncbi:MAG: phosphoribosyl-AMP cyclohydrolase [Hyphomicrobiaceae bacterium]|nr:phosphoribosyl-AMP cyclohydrolase [Hyphomicrobiaceae bacterium]